MTWPERAAISMIAILALAAIAGANQWNDRTILKFDAPMMVRGATLAPGTYVFELMDSQSTAHGANLQGVYADHSGPFW